MDSNIHAMYGFSRLLLLLTTLVLQVSKSANSNVNNCGINTTNPGCSCSKVKEDTNVRCFKLGLTQVPTFELGPTLIHTLSLECNNLTIISIGDFFGLKVTRLLLGNNSISHLNFLAFWGLEYHLDSLDLSFNCLVTVPSDALRLLRNLRSLSLIGNRISILHDKDFRYLGKLKILYLSQNPIIQIEDDAFAGTNLYMLILDEVELKKGLWGIPSKDLKLLKGLSVAKNKIEEIPDGWSRNLPSLTHLGLDHNKISTFTPKSLEGIHETLKSLELNGNKLKRIPRNAIRKLTQLESLELSYNRIKKIRAKSFNASKNLISLDLSHNVISDINVLAFIGLVKVDKIDLRSNALFTLDSRVFNNTKTPKIREVYIADNEWLCNCLVKWMKKDYKQQSNKVEKYKDLKTIRCIRPDYLSGRPLVRVPLRDFTCDHDYYYYYNYYEYNY